MNKVALKLDNSELIAANCSYWMHYEYEDAGYPLFFVELPNLGNRHIVRLLNTFDELYGNTDQETTMWALEYQLLTRMLVTKNQLLVNPMCLDLSDEDVLQAILTEATDKRIYMSARKISQEEIKENYLATLD